MTTAPKITSVIFGAIFYYPEGGDDWEGNKTELQHSRSTYS